MSATSTHPYATGTRWLRRLLSGQPHQVIGGHNDPYMLRWYVIPRNPLLNIYVHKFLRSDDDRALHDHPWWFLSLILRGEYREVTESGSALRVGAGWRFWQASRLIVFRRAEWRHRVALIRDDGVNETPCWTLIITGRRSRMWGFWCPRERFVPWLEFGDGGCGETS